jgi:acyl-CoA synthetase (AMP-forming)/AMP-acid ligase II
VSAAMPESPPQAALRFLHDALARWACTDGDKVALVCGTARVTYRMLDERSNALAAALASRGVRRGDRVMLYADNTPQAVVAFWAVVKAGAAVCPVNPLVKAGKLLRLIEDCRPSALITDAHLHRQWAHASARLGCVIYSGRLDDSQRTLTPAAVSWTQALGKGPTGRTSSVDSDADLAALLYTTGVDGEPLGIMLTHANMLAATESLKACVGLTAEDVVGCALPISSEHGLYPVLAACAAGARVVLERSFAFPGEALRRMAAESVTAFFAVPAIFGILASLKDPRQYDLSALRRVVSAGAGLSADAVRLLGTWFPDARIYSTHGVPECGRCVCLPPADAERKAGSVGLPLPGIELDLVDEQGRKVAAGVPGELRVSGAAVMTGYWGKPAETARTLSAGKEPGSRVLRTGAVFSRDADSYFHFVRRADGLLECRGERVAPTEIEAVVLAIPGVREAAAAGVPDATLGEAIKVFVVLEPGAALTGREVLRACIEKLENHRVPRFVEITAALPPDIVAARSRRGGTLWLEECTNE